ncbi:MAG: hypothetical protein AAB383_04350 [Patescibacteria group bacterium]
MAIFNVISMSPLEVQLEKDAKALSQMKFDDLPTEDEWLAIQSNF